MDLGTNFAAKLEPFLLMSKSAKGAAAAKLIQDATSAPGLFVFAELLALPNIQEVRSSIPALIPPYLHLLQLGKSETHDKFFSLLQLFSYKTYQDYLRAYAPIYSRDISTNILSEHKDVLPPLNHAQTIKLKHLSIVSMAAEKRVRATVFSPSLALNDDV